MAGFLSRLREGLSRTAAGIRERLGAEGPAAPDSETTEPAATAPGAPAAARGAPRVESLDALEDALLTADVGLAATERIIGAVRADRQGTLLERVRRVILQMLSEVAPAPAMSARPHVILVVGVNGTGKTTSVGKLAHYYTTQGQTVVIAAADTFRAAAIDQIAVWADRAGVELVRARPGTDPAAIAFDAVAAARARGRDVVLVDTAGRLHTRTNLMAELDKIRRVVGREVPGAPQEVLLVLDATVGQNGLVQAREFMAASGANGIVLTKLDGTAKGGVAITIAHELKLPIRFVGVGEGLDDLLPFDPSAYVDAIFTEKW